MARITKRLKQRDKFIIITNGKESEKNYFSKLRGFKHSIYDIDVKFENADPCGLINRAIREKQADNRVWIVFDKDEFPNSVIYETMQKAATNSIGVAFSNIAFEVWLITHFKEFNVERNAEELISILDTLLKQKGYSRGYNKNDSDVLSNVFFPLLNNAMNNANVALQKRIAEFNSTHPNDKYYPYCDWNSCTTVQKLISALKLVDKE